MAGVRIAAILGGGDWADASVDHVIMLTDRGSDSLLAEHGSEYEASRDSKGYARCSRFAAWLVEKGYARIPTDDELVLVVEE